MSVLLAVGVGFLAARFTWVLLRHTLDAPVFERTNYRNRIVPTAGGLVLAAAVFLVESLRVVFGAAGVGEERSMSGSRALVVLAVAGFTLLGLADDLGAVGTARGFRGHLRSLAQGRLTTGGLKLFGGGAIAVLLASASGRSAGFAPGASGVARLAVDAGVIALGANLANLFDRAPGRVIKVSGLSFVGLVAAAWVGDSHGALVGVALLVGASLGVVLDDLHERVMLGDTGANALGGTLGLGVVLTMSPTVRLAVVVVLVALNVVSEVVSFTKIIDGIGPLRSLDRAGSLRSGAREAGSGRRVRRSAGE